MQIKIQATRLLRETIQAQKQYKIICHEGGSRSGKTWSIFQFFILKALAGEKITVTIVRDKLTWIKATLLKDFQDMVEKYSLPVTPEVNVNRPEQVYYLYGSEFAFFGLDYAQKLHGRAQDWFWMNEVMEVSKSEFDQLEMRTRIGGILDYNPTDDSHWVFDLAQRNDVTVIHSTMLDNPFLPDVIVNKIKSYEPTPENILQGTADQYMWEVYGRGNRARLQGVILDNWDIVDSIPPEAKHLGYGLDFGFTNDPTSLVDGYLMDNEVYLDELIYEPGLTNTDIKNRMAALGVLTDAEIYADSAEPKSIEEIYRLGYRGIRAVVKGQDSVNFGIDIMKSHKIHLTRQSVNGEKEFRKYKWAEDRSGKSLNVPVDANNHFCDGARYLVMSKLNVQRKVRAFESKASIFS